ncbi:hypothetical protein L484_014604 [Morus notabilis]|uniref:Uncharacterized protein n=1 Tax=Morus notabilis TaxID=981085 RepID=W9R911_9ROSA|nr:hypothetical protein L484_014604 [Morus notabilis]
MSTLKPCKYRASHTSLHQRAEPIIHRPSPPFSNRIGPPSNLDLSGGSEVARYGSEEEDNNGAS